MRESGYYWVLYQGNWEVAEFTDNRWWVTGTCIPRENHDFEEIDENQIKRV
jgi:hypothetical protein